MQSIKFSINFPSRDRIPFVVNLLNSIKNNSFDLSSIEINIGVDCDDVDMNFTINSFHALFRELNIRFHKFYRDENITKYQNELAKVSTGEYIILICDDTEIRTKNWDKIIYEKLSNIEKPHMAAINDGINMIDMYTCFPIVSRDMLETCGYIFDERCWVWGGDVRLGLLFNKMGRYIKIPEVEIFHNSYHTGSRLIDDVGKRIERINSEHPNYDDDKWINETMEKLNVATAR